MALEDLTGNKYIDALVETNPEGPSDLISEGDDHIRGIKNVLKKTFPNIDGPVTVTQDDLNGVGSPNSEFPTGTKMVFYQNAAPTGWVKQSVNDRFLRVVSDTSGGSTGGSWNITGFSMTDSDNQVPVTISGGQQVATDIHKHSISHNGTWRGQWAAVIIASKS